MEVNNPGSQLKLDSKASPANAPQRRVTAASRIPMSLPQPRLAVPDLPGYYLYWHLGKNVQRAIRAGYEFVEEGEVDPLQHNVANGADVGGSTDMGTKISIAAGGIEENGTQPERLYLMKLPLEFHEQDLAKQAEINEGVARAIRAGNLGADGDPDQNKRYMKAGQDLFYPKNRPKA